LTDECVVTVLDFPTISQGEQKCVEITDNQLSAYFYFTPDSDGPYAYYSLSDRDTRGWILDLDMNELDFDTDTDEEI
jgi:hypothetical protein